MRKIILFLFVVTCVSLSHAQNEEEPVVADDLGWSQSFSDNWYIELGAGTHMLFSQDVENLDSKDRFTPSFTFAAGKWLTPVFGLELNLQGYSLNGFSTTEGTYTAVVDGGALEDPVRNEVVINPDGSYRHFIQYTNASINLLVSLVSIGGYKEDAKFDCIPFVGVGDMHVFEYKGIPKNDVFSLNYGVIGKFKATPRLDINLKVTKAVFDNEFEGRIAGDQSKDSYLAGNIGLVYYLKKRGFDKVTSEN
ncbi:hypothetical protein [Maribellus sediminis]|uniref:hypothetical protein n=1 Tax=Maribellus sediminis TaxID=2696285 RepID=UPI0014304841|nr:hypothetical protein [Maribellus sediminis]